MKKILLFFFIISSINGYSQLSVEPRAGLGVTGFSNVDEPISNVGYKLGISVNYLFTPSWGIQTGFFVTEKGVKNSKGFVDLSIKNEDNNLLSTRNWSTSLELRTNYFEIPLGVIYKYSVDSNVSFGLNFGGYVAYGYGGKGIWRFDGLNYSSRIAIFDKEKEIHLNSTYISTISINDTNNHILLENYSYKTANKIDCGLNGGVFVDVYNFSISANYDYGLTNVYKTYPIPSFNSSNNKNIKNKAFWISLGYKFKL